MTLLEQKIWRMPLIFLLTLWLGACSSSYLEEEDVKFDNSSNVTLLLSISTGDRARGLTRTDLVYEDPISDREKMISLRVIIVKNDGTSKVEYNEPITFETPTTYKNGLKYPVEFDTDYRIFLIANEEGLPSSVQNRLSSIQKNATISMSYLEDIIIESTDVGGPLITTENASVPMSEIFNIKTISRPDTESTVNEEVVQSETFFITRAAAKFSFFFFKSEDLDAEKDPTLSDATIQNWTIEKIKVTGLGYKEYLFPKETEYNPAKLKEDGTINVIEKNYEREIESFCLPSTDSGNDNGEYEFNLPGNGLKVVNLPTKPSDFNIDKPTAGLTDAQIANCVYSPLIYFPESKGDGGNAANVEIGDFMCTIKYNNEDFLVPVKFNNLPYGMPRNTHVAVIITIKPHLIEAAVDVIPFTAIELNPDFGLVRDDFGFIKGKDSQNRDCWYDTNYYEDENGDSNAIPLYLGPDKNNPSQLVSGLGPIVNKDPETGVESITYGQKNYLLVYADGDDYDQPVFEKAYIWGYLKDENGEYKVDEDGNKIWGPMPDYDENGYHKDAPQVNHYEQISGYERKASTLYMIIEEDTKKRYIISPESITKYKYDTNGGFYLNQLRQRVWLDSTIAIIPPGKTTPDGLFHSHRVYFEWDILEWNYAVWDRLTDHYPKAWFDVFGNRYLWEEGNTKEKRDQVLRNKYGDLVDYLEGNPKNTN